MDRLNRIRELMGDQDALFITSKANIFYYSGFTSEDASLLITKDASFIITDSRYFLQAKKEAPDFILHDIGTGLNSLFSKLNLKCIGYEEKHLTVHRYNNLKNSAFSAEFVPFGDTISFPRRIKTPDEIEKIRLSEALARDAFYDTVEKIKAGMTEKEVKNLLEFYMLSHGASCVSFDTIVASGKRGALPHGVASDKIIEQGDLVTMDFGCILDGYCSDMTRTICVGTPSPRQREIYSVVLKAQEAALIAIRPGVPCAEIDEISRKIIADAGYGEYFTHSLGHSVGIEIHESPNLSPKSEAIAEVGNVITIEPGIYIEDFGGVRIEDVMAVREDFSENLTKCEKELIII